MEHRQTYLMYKYTQNVIHKKYKSRGTHIQQGLKEFLYFCQILYGLKYHQIFVHVLKVDQKNSLKKLNKNINLNHNLLYSKSNISDLLEML